MTRWPVAWLMGWRRAGECAALGAVGGVPLSRCEADVRARTAVSPHHTLTPRAETATEVSLLWGLEESQVRRELNRALFLHRHFPGVWELCRTGRLDAFRASVIADHLRHTVADPVQLKEVASRLGEFLARHLSAGHGIEGLPPVVVCTAKQLRSKLDYEVRRLQPADAEARHREARARRSVRTSELPDGMAHLGVTATVDQVLAARQRLMLAAKQLRAQGDGRTLAPLCSDLAMDLLCGREAGVPVPRFAHPVTAAPRPATGGWPEVAGPEADEVQFSATELLAALHEVRNRRDQQRGEIAERDRILEWEHGYRLDQLAL